MSSLLLSIGGGGVLGIGPATFLRNWEESHKALPLSPDALAGTSVGSILVAAKAIGLSWAEVETLFIAGAPVIFRKPGWLWRIDPRKPKYDGTGLVEVLKKVFGSIRMNQTKTPVFIPAMDYSRGRPKVWGPEDDTYVWEAVAASCSAPTFFPPRPGQLVDGGLVANSPSMVGIAGAISKLGWELEESWCISMGTNGDYWVNPKIGENTSKIGWADVLLSNITRGNEELSVFQTAALLQRRFLHIDPQLDKNWSLDDLRAIPSYAGLWQYVFELKQFELEIFLQRMV